MKDCRKRIAALWLFMAGLCFLIMVAQSFGGAFADKTVEAWGWFLANTMPTISVVVANLVSDAGQAGAKAGDGDRKMDSFYYRLCMIVSFVYLLMILVTLLGWRVTSYEDPVAVMAFSSIWMAPLQGITVSIISIFFRKAAQPPQPAARGRAPASD